MAERSGSTAKPASARPSVSPCRRGAGARTSASVLSAPDRSARHRSLGDPGGRRVGARTVGLAAEIGGAQGFAQRGSLLVAERGDVFGERAVLALHRRPVVVE